MPVAQTNHPLSGTQTQHTIIRFGLELRGDFALIDQFTNRPLHTREQFLVNTTASLGKYKNTSQTLSMSKHLQVIAWHLDTSCSTSMSWHTCRELGMLLNILRHIRSMASFVSSWPRPQCLFISSSSEMLMHSSLSCTKNTQSKNTTTQTKPDRLCQQPSPRPGKIKIMNNSCWCSSGHTQSRMILSLRNRPSTMSESCTSICRPLLYTMSSNLSPCTPPSTNAHPKNHHTLLLPIRPHTGSSVVILIDDIPQCLPVHKM